MKFHVMTLFPEMIQSALQQGVVGQAFLHGKLELHTYNPRDFSVSSYQSVDDRAFGGGEGMILMPSVLDACLSSIDRTEGARKIYLSPKGRGLSDDLAQELSRESELVLLCGRYDGVDQRFLDHHNFEGVSIGDYVISGGELAALVLIDAVARKKEGVLGNQESAQRDSFVEGLLEAPLYTKPRDWNGIPVPPILLSGHHQKIEAWKLAMAYFESWRLRKDLFIKKWDQLDREEKRKLLKIWQNLMTDQSSLPLQFQEFLDHVQL